MNGQPWLTLDHRIAIGASQLGMSTDEYVRHIRAGEKWCTGHHDWHPRAEFGKRESLPDGLNNICRAIDRERARLRMRDLAARRRAIRARAGGR